MKDKKLILAVAILATVAISLVGMTTYASYNGTSDTLAEKIATHFNLDKEEVQGVIDEYKANMKSKKIDSLKSESTDSTLTKEQWAALKEKYAELGEKKEALKDQDLTKEEMIAEMKTIHAELATWAEENDIDLKSLKPDKGAWTKKGLYDWKK